MIEMVGITAAIVWLVIAVVFFVVESSTYQLVCIWFMVGALGSMLVSFFGVSFSVQLWVFLIASVASLVIIRPLLKDKIKVKPRKTNADRVIGMTGLVTETVDNLAGTGRVDANGLSWSARAHGDGQRIAVEERVRVLAIEGVKLIVEPIMNREN